MRVQYEPHACIKIFSSSSSSYNNPAKYSRDRSRSFAPHILQHEIQRWLAENSDIKILQMQQSTHMQETEGNNLPWITITILYKIPVDDES